MALIKKFVRAWSNAWGRATSRPGWAALLGLWCVEELLEVEVECGGWTGEALEAEPEEVLWGEPFPWEVCSQLYTVFSPLVYRSVSNPVVKLCQGYTHCCTLSDVSMCCTGKRVPTGGLVRGRGSASRLAMRRGGRHRGGIAGRGGALIHGVARGGVARGQGWQCFFF